MISESKSIKLINIYLHICEIYDNELKHHCEKFTKNDQPKFSDQESMTIYLFAVEEEQRTKVKQIHSFACEYLRDWFPDIGSYADFNNREFYGDKIYCHKSYFEKLKNIKNSLMLTPITAIKAQDKCGKQFYRASNDLYSQSVSSNRQPIESFFNWLIERIDIQKSSKIRSTKGLLVHVFGKLTAAFISYIS